VIPEQAIAGERRDIYIAASNLTEAMHGDRVVARIERQTDKGPEGRIIRILERSQETVVGRYEVDAAGLGYVVPFDRRLVTDVHVPSGQSSSAEPSEMVVVEITRWPTATRGPVGRSRSSG
jgi:ribonuclease R